MLVILSVLDRKAQLFSGLFLARNIAVGCRMFAESVNPDTVIGQHPEDFVLCGVGGFDEEEGVVHPSPVLELLEASAVADEKRGELSARTRQVMHAG